MKKLKPCPWCNTANKLEVLELYYDGPHCCVRCNRCPCCGPEKETRIEAINAWNKQKSRLK